MLKNNKVNAVLALLIAIFLWIYVMSEVNPTATSTIRNVPVTYMSEEALEEEGLTLLSVSDETINVTISGQRDAISKIRKSDIEVYADLEGYTEGEHTITLRIEVPDTVELASDDPVTVTVVIDELVSEVKPISTSLTGESSDDSEPYIVQISQDEVTVTGARTLVDSVVRVNAPLDISRISMELKTFNVTLIPVDEGGSTVDGVKLDTSRISITAVLFATKTVELEVPITGSDDDSVDRTVTVPKTITIKGTEEDIEGISSVTAETIDVSGIYEDTSITIVPILPSGIVPAANSQDLTAQVTVRGMDTVTFDYNSDAITVEGASEDMTVTLSEITIRLMAIGREQMISELNADDFYFTVDVSGLEEGTYTLSLECVHDDAISNVEFAPLEVEVRIEIEEMPDEEETDELISEDEE